MTNHRVTLLSTEMDETWDMLKSWCEGLTDAEVFWMPVPDCWTVRSTEEGRWIVDYEYPPPDKAPLTTIAWKLDHLAACKLMYQEYAFGEGKLTWDEITMPHTASDAITFLVEAHDRLRQELDHLCDADLDEMRLTNWGEMWPTWRIFWAMISHDLHHGAEIGCLRDLYREMHSTG